MATNQFVDFKVVKEQVSIEKAVTLLGLTMRKHGDSMRAPCPTCKAAGDRALAVSLNKNSYYCFAQGAGGDVIAFAAHVRGLSQRDAAVFLSGGTVSTASTAHSSDRSPSPAGKVVQEGRREPLRPLDYLVPAHEAVQSLGISAATAEALGGGFAGRGTMRGRVLFPIHSRDGTLLAYCGIATSDEQSPRFLFPSNFDPATAIWNCQRVGPGELYLVRDVLKAVLAIEAGMENVVAFLTETIQPQQLETLASLMDEKKVEHVELY
jgi:hypothetical protein